MAHLQITITGLKVLLVPQALMAVPKCYPQLHQVGRIKINKKDR